MYFIAQWSRCKAPEARPKPVGRRIQEARATFMADQLSRHTAGALTELLNGKVQPAHQRFLLDVRPADDIDPAIDGYSSNAWACAEDARSGSAGGSTKASAVRVGDSTSMHRARQLNGPGFGSRR